MTGNLQPHRPAVPVRRVRRIAYWAFTLPVAFENAAGAVWTFSPLIPLINQLHASSVFDHYQTATLAHLGYPLYFRYILGPWQIACAAALLAPRLPRLKEWAYAGAFFNYSSALVSHLWVGDRAGAPAAVMAVFTVASWALRPPDRRLAEPAPAAPASARSWIQAAGILCLLLILAFFWLPR